MTSWLQDNVFFLSFFVQYRHYSIFCMHKIQYFSINWRLSGVASRDLQREEEGSMQAFDVSVKTQGQYIIMFSSDSTCLEYITAILDLTSR